MADKPKGDVTRKAVELATKSVAKATEHLKTLLYTGPDQVMMTPKQIEEKVTKGNTELLPYAQQSADAADNELLERMLANGQIRGK
tara:strand:- start:369 stop:626 length:258 start_codon:yes stop_codon:yes gene_type:complete